jgi:hypothetical protein
VFFIGKEDGSLEAWDIIDSSNQAVMMHNVSSPDAITVLEPFEAMGGLRIIWIRE